MPANTELEQRPQLSESIHTVSRRAFLRGSAALGAAAVVVGTGSSDLSAISTPSAERGESAEVQPVEILSVDEIVERHHGQWIIMRITAVDEDYRPSHGEVMFHGDSPKEAGETLFKFISIPEHEESHFYIFSAFRVIKTGKELREALANEWLREETTGG